MKKLKKVFDENANVEVRKMNNIVEVKLTNYTYYDENPKHKRIDKNSYIDLDTGEIKKYIDWSKEFFPEDNTNFLNDEDFYDFMNDVPSQDDEDLPDEGKQEESDPSKKDTKSTDKKKSKKTRLSSPKSLRKTRKLNKELIITNFHSPKRTMFVTFVYNNRMEDTEKVGNQMNYVIRKLREKFATDTNKMKYIYVMEYDHTGSIHVHALYYWDSAYPEQAIDYLTKIWRKKGRIHHEPIRDPESITFIAAYLTYGLTEKDVTTNRYSVPNASDEKQEVKHARLSYFKPYQRFFRHSDYMEKTVKEEMTYKKAEEKYGLDNCFYTGEFHFDDKKTGTIIDQTYEYHLLL
ncbi:MAG: hypothetical protein PUB43_05340 [Oscillospiraceae bacterium]|nr:hypothetical protein [Oscillospiraceae bacterium]